MNFRKKTLKEIKISSEEIVKVVSDGIIATVNVADGRSIPVLIIDTSSRPDLEDLIKAHCQITPGDSRSLWSQNMKGTEKVWLVITFERPSSCRAVFEFDTFKNGGIVDHIINSEAVYIQSSKEGERLSDTLDKEGIRILIEIPSEHFKAEWNEKMYDALVNDGKKKGLKKALAKEYASDVIKEWRQVIGMRVKGH